MRMIMNRESTFVRIKQLEAALSTLEIHKARSDTSNRAQLQIRINELVSELKRLDEKMITRKY